MARNQLTPDSNVIISGVSGLLGGEILREICRLDVNQITALVRSNSEQTSLERFYQRMERSGKTKESFGTNLTVADCDITRPFWDLSPAHQRNAIESVDTIIHCAADTSFIRERNVIDTNIAGTKNLIELARACKRRPRIVFVSTATNVGRVQNCNILEDQGCQPGNDHHNAYTASKAVAETMLRESGLDVLVIRPTIVLSAGIKDRIFARNILWFAPLVFEFEALPLICDSKVDIISCDYQSKGVVELLRHPGLAHDCYHISAGERNAITVAESLTCLRRNYVGKDLQMIHPDHWGIKEQRRYVRSPLQRKIFHGLKYYLPFLNMNVTYDNDRFYQALGPRSPEFVPFDSYVDDLLAQINLEDAICKSAIP